MNNHYLSSIEGLSPESTSQVNAHTVSHSPLSAAPSIHSEQRPEHRLPRSISHFLYFLLLFLPISNALAGTQFGPVQFDQDNVSPALQAFALLTVLSLAPSILIMLSSFTRIVVVLSMLRNALGLQQTPPNTVLISLSLFLTLFTMMPVAKAIYTEAYQPYENKQINTSTALNRAAIPLKQFMIKQTREKDMQVILELAKEPLPASADEIKLYQLIPAFILSELQTAFQIGFMIFLPFLLVDLIVSGILMTMGMMMMPPMSISLPVKILLFILIDGWDLVVQALVGSFN
ncbi:flagellar type III secretion system pore protein FliP [Legionella bononiensis]|uniref:Flagellar biosynthetic protein FliP n=1 Tax=Legionella bononiensis TaxID=2793102 RepID=A0ABS1WD42_9GAMM|nr:flagellar type III secretion system pore protein FliP [Legionella bononiensis]MBL7479142.1 flagellar type III secretion system pore protein FliP [Legionella bononiensis]MBL7527275.1 flagellar type III secretion system pore protein FliP [Legionella bononiensis]MBL7562244.1 flagellar type III secretion system pore protein FliP [Legionella bononiensis]